MANGDLNAPEVIPDDTLPEDEVPNEKKKVPRLPKCARCHNHGIDVPVKGHKHFCPYKKCTCKPCRLVKERQEIMAKQISWTRYQQQLMARNELEVQQVVGNQLEVQQVVGNQLEVQQVVGNQLEAQEQEVEQFEAHQEVDHSEVSEETEEAILDVEGISSGNVTPEPPPASAFDTSQANSIVDYKRLRESLHQVTSQFGYTSAIVEALYITVLKDNEYNYETVKKKIEEGKRDARNIGVALHSPHEAPVTPPSSHCSAFVPPATFSSSPATPIINPLVIPYNPAFYAAYGHYGPAHHHQLLDAAPPFIQHHHPAPLYHWHPSPPSGSPAGGVVTPDAVRYSGGGASNSHPASNNSGEESRGSQPSPADYKEDSEDKGQSPPTSHKEVVAFNHAAAAAMRSHPTLASSLDSYRRYMPIFDMAYHQDRRETAANA